MISIYLKRAANVVYAVLLLRAEYAQARVRCCAEPSHSHSRIILKEDGGSSGRRPRLEGNTSSLKVLAEKVGGEGGTCEQTRAVHSRGLASSTLADGGCARNLLPKSSGGNKCRSLNAMFK